MVQFRSHRSQWEAAASSNSSSNLPSVLITIKIRDPCATFVNVWSLDKDMDDIIYNGQVLHGRHDALFHMQINTRFTIVCLIYCDISLQICYSHFYNFSLTMVHLSGISASGQTNNHNSRVKTIPL